MLAGLRHDTVVGGHDEEREVDGVWMIGSVEKKSADYELVRRKTKT